MKIDLTDLMDAYMDVCGIRFPPGEYQAKIISSQIEISHKAKMQAKFTVEIIHPSTGRRKVVSRYVQLDKKSVFYLQRDLKILGVSLTDINQLSEALQNLEGISVKVNLTDDGKWYQINFLCLIEETGE